ncbi:WbqC family protein [Arcobacter cryaerophilus gv. pseudocryaerophilus]|uniref:WbqC family protein n=3 Tax=Arcobacteraceae TaxID=2808963 RepID=A0AA96IKK9_9BACT|nr:WbqC family protein [Arcobacter sp. AZ-2023]WNL36557.1 WbqC family protein [Arcobacter sp. AZ-2023]WPD12273.1 WbqC family protein [Arcobacter sp. DSM 115960]
MKKIAILQSNYIPWKGYFDLINMVDEFIFYDEVQYTKNDWRNRNKIKTPQGIQWLTIPVRQESLDQKIKDTKISDKKWNIKHWRTISQNYSKAKYFKDYKDIFEELYLNCDEEYLSQINYKFITTINEILEIKTKLRWSSEFELVDGQTEKLLGICKECNADIYLTGPAAKDYFNEELAKQENIKVEWMDYSGYKEYEQLNPPFEHGVTILDLIFNEGDRAKEFMKSFK